MIHILVTLNARDPESSKLRDYEAKVLPLVRRCGGRVLSAFTPQRNGDQGDPDEIHLLEFPSRDHLARYRGEVDLLELAAEREAAILSMRIDISEEIHLAE